jgi:hypothetical protein
MIIYRMIVGWTVRIVIYPLLVVFMLLRVFLGILDAGVTAILGVAEKLEEWERPADDWRPLSHGENDEI